MTKDRKKGVYSAIGFCERKTALLGWRQGLGKPALRLGRNKNEFLRLAERGALRRSKRFLAAT